MKQFVRVVNGKREYAPEVVRVDCHDVIGPNEETLAKCEPPYLELMSERPADEEGFYFAATGALELRDGKYYEVYEKRAVEPPKAVYVKYYLGMAIQECGYIEMLLAFFASNPVLAFHWNNANEFEEGDRNFEYIKGELAKLVGESGVNAVFAKYREIYERKEAVNA